MGVFVNILKYKKNQWLKIELLAVCNSPNIIDGSDRDCGTHNIGFQTQNHNQHITASFCVHIHCSCDLTIHVHFKNQDAINGQYV